jgi:hypothetical protein
LIHIERATSEDLHEIWPLAADFIHNPAQGERVVSAVNAKRCYVAKQGWSVVGALIREDHFFGYPLLSLLVVHPDHPRDVVVTALFHYAEQATPARPIFSACAANDSASQHLLVSFGYLPAGQVLYTRSDGLAEALFGKLP